MDDDPRRSESVESLRHAAGRSDTNLDNKEYPRFLISCFTVCYLIVVVLDGLYGIGTFTALQENPCFPRKVAILLNKMLTRLR